MSVCIFGMSGHEWGQTAAAAVTATGSATLFIGSADVPAIGATAAGGMPTDTRVALVSSAVPLALISAFFAFPPARAGRKIVAVAEGELAALPLFEIADMLIFSPAAFAGALGLTDAPKNLTELLAVQGRLTRHNQAAVVYFAGKGAAALWADRTLFVAAAAADRAEPAMAHFAGVIAAAVDQGIGPEQALAMAMTTASTAS